MVSQPVPLGSTESRRLDAMLMGMRNARQGCDLQPWELPSEHEIVYLNHRGAELASWLVGTDPNVVDQIVMPLLMRPSAISGEVDAKFLRGVYADVLSEQPRFAIE